MSGPRAQSKEHAEDRRAPVSLLLLFAPVFAAVFLLHSTLLRLPYFWDEAGYYIPAAWDFFRLGTLIPITTLTNAHPPLPSILLAAWWRVAGFSVFNTRLLVCLVASAALLAVFRFARLFLDIPGALAVMALTAIYPVWFAQSTLAHADIFAAALTLWGLSFYFDREAWTGRSADATANAVSAAIFFALAALAKETAILVPVTLCLLEGVRYLRHKDRTDLVRASAFACTVLPLAGWYLYHRLRTGFTFGNPEYLRYNAGANLSASRIALSLWHRLIHLTVHMNLWVAVAAALIALALAPSAAKRTLPRGAVIAIAALLAAQWIGFSVLGGALLTRYLLPAYPLLLLLCVAAWERSWPKRWWIPAALSIIAFAIGCEVNPPYPYAPEDNLGYRDMVVVEQHAITQLVHRYPGATVLTAWPVQAYLQRPELGYVREPVHVVRLENFSAEQIAKAAAEPSAYDVALVFSLKYDPGPGPLNPQSRANDERFYDYHRDLPPAQIARALGGSIVWQEERKGEWAALITFPRSYEASLSPPMWENRMHSGVNKE